MLFFCYMRISKFLTRITKNHKAVILLSSCLFLTGYSVRGDYPPITLNDETGIRISGNGSVIQLHPDSKHSKPIISWFDYATGKQAAWLVAHDYQPPWEGDSRHRHFSIETSKSQMGWLTTRMEFPFGEDVIDIGIYDSNLKLMPGHFMYYNLDKNAGMFFDEEPRSLTLFAPQDMRMKSKNGSFKFYADKDLHNRSKNSEVRVYGAGHGDEYVRLAHNGRNSILQTKKGSLLIDQQYHTPSSSSEACKPKAFAFDERYVYLCNAEGKWGRTQLEYDW